jgi:hypothetical protein
MSGNYGTISVQLLPNNPGILVSSGATVTWTTSIFVTGGINQVAVATFASNGVIYGNWTVVALSGGYANVSVSFYANGDYFAVSTSVTAPVPTVVSAPVTIRNPGVPTVSIIPQNPGLIVTNTSGQAQWSTAVITTGGLTQIQWAVFASNGVPRNSWTTTNLVGTSVELLVTFQATGDYLFVSQVGNPSVGVQSGPATLVGEPATTISLNPYMPGNIVEVNNVTSWSTTITATGGLTQVQWAVFTSANIARSAWNILPLQNGSAKITVNFIATGDYLLVTEVNNLNVTAYSGAVTVVSNTVTVSMNPTDPGTIQLVGGVAPWTTTITTTGGLTQVQWAVFTSANVARSSWNIVNLTNGSVSLTVNFIASGDYLIVTEVGNTNVAADSGQVVVSTPTLPTVSLSPQNPGSILQNSSGGATWLTTASATGSLVQLQWQIFSSAGVGRGGYTTANLVSGSVVLTASFLSTGDYLEVTEVGNTTVNAVSGPVTIYATSSGSLSSTFSVNGTSSVKNSASASVSLLNRIFSGTLDGPTQVGSGTLTIPPLGVNGVVNTPGTNVAIGLEAFPILSITATGYAQLGGSGSVTMHPVAPSGVATINKTSSGTDTLPTLAASGNAAITLKGTASTSLSPTDFSASGVATAVANVLAIAPSAPGTLNITSPVWATTISVPSSLGVRTLNWGVKNAAGSLYSGLTSQFLTPYPIGTSSAGDITLATTSFGPYTASSIVTVTINSTQSTLEASTFNQGVQVGGSTQLVVQNGSATYTGTFYENNDYFAVWSSSTITDYAFTNPVVISTVVPPPAPSATGVGTISVTFTNTGDYLYIEDPNNTSIYAQSSPVAIQAATTLSLTPHNPGTLVANESFTCDISTYGMSQIQYGIYTAGNLQGTLTTISLSGTTLHNTTIVTSFSTSGQYLQAFDSQNTAISVSGGTVTIASAQTLTLNPSNPGTLPSTSKSWFTVVEANPPITGTVSGGNSLGTTVPYTVSILQGQSNADFLTNLIDTSIPNIGAYSGWYQPIVELLTGLPHIVLASTGFDPSGGITILSGEPTYDTTTASTSTGLWLNGYGNGATPSTWPLGTAGSQMQSFINYWVNPSSAQGQGKQTMAASGAPVVLLRFHSEYDSTKTGTDLSYYAAANMSFIQRIFSWCGVPASQFVVGYSMPAYVENTNDAAMQTIRSAWGADIAGTSGSGYSAFWACTSNYDVTDRADLSHTDPAGDVIWSVRTACAVARWLYNNGYSKNNLSFLPKGGPRIVSFSVTGTTMTVNVQHDKGTDLIIPAATAVNGDISSNLSAFTITDSSGALSVTAWAYNSSTSFNLTLSRVTTGVVTLDYLIQNAFFGPNNLITDNWHTNDVSKPQWAVNILFTWLPKLIFPISKLDAPIVGNGTVLTPIDGPSPPIPTPATTHNASPVTTAVTAGVAILGINYEQVGTYTPNSQAISIAGSTTAATWSMYNNSGALLSGPNSVTFVPATEQMPSVAPFGVSWSSGNYIIVEDTNNSSIFTRTDPLWYPTVGSPNPPSVNYPNGGTGNPITGQTVSISPTIQYAPFSAGGTLEGTWTIGTLTNGVYLDITTAFQNSGDYLKVELAANTNVSVVSNSVVISGGTTTVVTGGVISITPNAPGTITLSSSQQALWTTDVQVSAAGSAPAYSGRWAYSAPQSANTLVSVAFPTAQTAGNANIVLVGADSQVLSAPTVTDSNGNTYTQVEGGSFGSNTFGQIAYAAFNISGGNNTITATFAAAASYPDVRIGEFSGVSAVDSVGQNFTTSGTTMTVTVTTSVANDIVVGGFYVGNSVASVGTGFTNIGNTSPNGDNFMYGLVTTAGTVNMVAYQGSASWWAGTAVALKPTAGSGGGSLPSSVQWAVLNNTGTAYTAFNTLNLTGPSNSQSLTTQFYNTGDYLHVQEIGGATIYANSGTVTIGVPPLNSPVSMSGWTNILYEPFVGTTLNSNVWRTYGNVPSGQPPIYFNDTANIISNGYTGMIWSSGGTWYGPGLQTKGPTFSEPYAANFFRAELKVCVPPVDGVGPYFVMQPDNGNAWPNWDIAEYPHQTGTNAGQLMTTWHSDGNTSETSLFLTFGSSGQSTAFHTLTVEHTSSGFQFWVDGVSQDVLLPPSWTASNDTTAVFSIGIGGVAFPSSTYESNNWFGTITSSTPNPYYFYVDYVAMWKPSGGGGSGPLATAQNFVANLTAGVQIPRSAPTNLSYGGNPITSGTAYWQYLTAAGITHACFMYPWTDGQTAINFATPSTSDPQFQAVMTCMSNAQSVGMTTVFRLIDNINSLSTNMTNWLSTSGSYIASTSGLSPSKTLIVPTGELIYGSNSSWNPSIITANQLLRTQLPQSAGWVLGVGGAYWQSVTSNCGDQGNILLGTSSKSALSGDVPRTLAQNPDGSDDLQCVMMIDNYPDNSGGNSSVQSYYAMVAGYMQSFQTYYQGRAGGLVPMIMHEVGCYTYGFCGSLNWTGAFAAIGSGGGKYCPCFWDVSNADGQYSFNASSSDASFPAYYTEITNTCNFIKGQSYYGNGSGR